MASLFRGAAIVEFAGIGLTTLYKIFSVLGNGSIADVIMVLITAVFAVFLVLPLYVLGDLMDEVKMLRKEVFARKPVNEELHNRHILVSGGWKCSCGRANAAYISTCTCGKNKYEAE